VNKLFFICRKFISQFRKSTTNSSPNSLSISATNQYFSLISWSGRQK